MVKRIFALTALLPMALLTGGCVMGTVTQETLLGNYSFSRGDYQGSTVHYLEAYNGNRELQPWVAYNLGNVYHSLGEVSAAQRMWNIAAQSSDKNLLFAVHFNRGIALYEGGRFDEAYKEFREALVLNPTNTDTKLNLELAQKKLFAASVGGGVREVVTNTQERSSEDAARLLEYVRRKEGRQWVPPVVSDEDESPANDW